MCKTLTKDTKELSAFRSACKAAQRTIQKLTIRRPLESTELLAVLVEAIGVSNLSGCNLECDPVQVDAFRIIDEQRVELLRLKEEMEKKENTSIESEIQKMLITLEEYQKETSRKFQEMRGSEGIQKCIDDDQMKMAMEKIEKLEKENSTLKDQVTSNFFELEHRAQKIQEKDQKIQKAKKILRKKNETIQELTSSINELEMEVQEQYQRTSILQKDLQDSESSSREILRSHDRVVQTLMEQKEKDKEMIEELLKKQEAHTSRIAYLTRRNQFLRSEANSRVQALKDSVAQKDMEIESLKERVTETWR